MNYIEATKEKIKVMQAFVDDVDIQHGDRFDSEDDWSDTNFPVWNWAQYDYRIKKSSPDSTPLNIPWDWIDRAYNYAAMDRDGSVWLFTHTVVHSESQWYSQAGDYELESFEFDTISEDVVKQDVNWKTSLTERPKK